MYAIEKNENGDISYLNHAYLNSKSFGSDDMAWLTEDFEKANLMLESVKNKYNNNSNIVFTIVELY